MYYIVGLGNPEKKYEHTRHNVGFEMVEHLRQVGDFGDWNEDKYAQANVVSGSLRSTSVELFQPLTYMNKSGETTKYIIEKLGGAPEQVIVLYDDVDLPVGELKISIGRGAGGHNGIRSIIDHIGKDFIRIRIGVAGKHLLTGKVRRPHGSGMSRHVLGKFSFFEKGTVKEMRDQVYKTVDILVNEGIEKAMNQYN